MNPLPASAARIAIGLASALLLLAAPSAVADWTTYHRDPARSGVDPSSTGSVPFAIAWASPTLGGAVYAEPLVFKGLVVVATENNDVYALNEATGQVMWHVGTGTPVPAAEIGSLVGCGDISPTVGITSTPVIDPATNRVFVVADTWDGSKASTIQHRLFGFNLADGSPVTGSPVAVDPPGSDHAALLQRTALALDAGKVIVGYGGNDGDCGTYHGWLVAAPETGGALQSFGVSQSSGGGAIWGAGDGAAVDGSGDIWAATGNGFGPPYDYQESVIKLDSNLNLLASWAPSNWQALDDGDTDLGSSEPLLLPGGLVFQIGKQGVGYLLSASSPGGTGAPPRYQAQICGGGSFGGDVYYAGAIYVTCTDGMHAVSLNASAQTFAPVPGWQVHSDAIGPPIVSGGLVWVAAWNAAKLYGLNPQTGSAVVTGSTPGMEHFTTPAASDGKLFLATGRAVQAYAIANPAGPSPGPSPTPPTSGSQIPTCGCRGKRCRTRLALTIPRHSRVTRASVYLGRKRLASERGHRLRRISFPSPAHRRSFTIRVVEFTSRHHRLTFKVTFRDCRRVARHGARHSAAPATSMRFP
jgi:polyvinyl alcohol dehydrogenase (cytochrome)